MSDTTEKPRNNARVGIGFIVLAMFCISVNDMIIKQLSGSYPLHQMVFVRSGIGIAFSLFVCVIAALNLVLDFDFIERGAQQGLAKDFEWYAAFGLLVTIIWLYLEMLRLFSKLRQR